MPEKKSQSKFAIVQTEKIYGLNPYLQTVYVWLSHHSDRHGLSFPSISCLENETGMKRCSVIRSLKKLEELGIIIKTRRKNTSNLYQIVKNGQKPMWLRCA